jgi:hypothetical protein
MTTPTDQLTALHELAKTWPGGIEQCEWWRRDVELVKRYWSNGYDFLAYTDGQCGRCDGSVEISTSMVLDLITAEAERYLVGKGWVFERQPKTTCYTPNDYTIRFHTLPEALAHAATTTPDDQSSSSSG